MPEISRNESGHATLSVFPSSPTKPLQTSKVIGRVGGGGGGGGGLSHFLQNSLSSKTTLSYRLPAWYRFQQFDGEGSSNGVALTAYPHIGNSILWAPAIAHWEAIVLRSLEQNIALCSYRQIPNCQ